MEPTSEVSAGPQFRLKDLYLTVLAYGLLLALCASLGNLNPFHFSMSFSVALMMLTPKLCWRPNRTPLDGSVLFVHFWAAIGHAIILAIYLYQGEAVRRGRDMTALEGIGFFLVFGSCCLSMVGLLPLLTEGVKEKRYGFMLYGFLGALPFAADLALLHWYRG